MPIYEYKCNDCGKLFEILTTSAGENKDVVCENCQSGNTLKVLSATAIRTQSTITQAPAPPSGCKANSGFS